MLRVHQSDLANKERPQKEAVRQQLSVDESKPSYIVRHYFGKQHGFELGERKTFSFDAPKIKDQRAS